jgi:hypothetical protein
LVFALGCRASQPVAPLGGKEDDGAGELAKASTKLMTEEDSGADPFAPRKRRPDPDALGGTTYGNYVVSPWQSPPAVHRTYPRHQQQANLAGAIEGTITWRGALPGKHPTACGPQQLVHVGANRGVADVVIYIEQVKVGRAMPTDGHIPQVGGVVVKRGCTLRPAAQIVTPLPAALTIHGDPTATKLRVTPPDAAARVFELQEGGKASVPVGLGMTRVESEDGSVASAWVLGSDAPYYAITDDHGRFRIDELASGTYELTIWHAPLPNEASGKLAYGNPIIVKRTVTVAGTRIARLDVSIGR